MKNALLIFALAIAVCPTLMAQSDSIRFESLMDARLSAVMFASGGDTMVAHLIHIDSSSLTVEFDDGGRETYFKDEITLIKYYLGRQKIRLDTITGKYIERVFLNSTAFNLPKGEAEYRNVMLFYNGFHKGVSDNITIGGAIIPSVLINLALLDAKASIKIADQARLGVGLVAGVGFGGDLGFKPESLFVAGGFTALTLGNKKRFINLLVGRAAGQAFDDNYGGEWIFSLGGRLSGKRANFYTEFTRHPAFFMELANVTGFTFKIKSFIYEAGLLMPLQDFFLIPAVSLSRRF